MSGSDIVSEKANAPDQKALEHQDASSDEGETLEAVLGYKPELQRNRSMFTLLFQSLAIAAVR